MYSGYVKYKLSGGQEGIQETYFTEWGLKEVKITKASMDMGGEERRPVNTTFIITPELMVNFDRVTKKGVKFPKPDYTEVYAVWEEHGGDFGKVQDFLVAQSGMKSGGTGIVLGKTCKIWKQEQGNMKLTIWSWKGIQLKIKQEVQGFTFIQTAVEIKENVVPDENLFKVPDDISWTDPNGQAIE